MFLSWKIHPNKQSLSFSYLSLIRSFCSSSTLLSFLQSTIDLYQLYSSSLDLSYQNMMRQAYEIIQRIYPINSSQYYLIDIVRMNLYNFYSDLHYQKHQSYNSTINKMLTFICCVDSAVIALIILKVSIIRVIVFIIKMRAKRLINEEYNKILTQIDQLKSNINKVIDNNQDGIKTVRKHQQKAVSKSPITSRIKTPVKSLKKPKQKDVSCSKAKQEIVTQDTIQNNPPQYNHLNKIWQKVMQIQAQNNQIKQTTNILQGMLKDERSRRKKLQKKLKQTQTKKAVGIQKDTDNYQIPQNSRIFTPFRFNNRQPSNKKNTKTRQDQIDSFLLGDCDQFNYISPKKRNNSQIEIMQLLQQMSRPGQSQNRDCLKYRLVQAVKKFIKR